MSANRDRVTRIMVRALVVRWGECASDRTVGAQGGGEFRLKIFLLQSAALLHVLTCSTTVRLWRKRRLTHLLSPINRARPINLSLSCRAA